ncbi:unnamed protein product [Owenia fusiformis]|uniref:EGF-like domain-containing protein n=1 Tax=Owenia fusiformis TaxID=6347 RepID=A0A8S4P2I8_OWEFU|nr:unnamed protein product [Owenia fusiformis]
MQLRLKWCLSMTFLMVLMVLIVMTDAANIDEGCESVAECPADARCITRGCDGKFCVCNTGFLPSEDKTTCGQAADLGEQCNPEANVFCLRPNSRCPPFNPLVPQRECECEDEYFESSGRCRKDPTSDGTSFPLLGEACDNSKKICSGLFQDCVSNVCTCKDGYRAATVDDISLEPSNTFECRLDIDLMNNTQVSCPSIVKIYEECDSDENCIPNAACKARGCNSNICICNVGTISNVNNDQCLQVSTIGGSCNDTIRCPGGRTVCVNSICECQQGYIQVDDTRCKEDISNFKDYTWSLLGEDCKETGDNQKVCHEKEQECKDGTCQCKDGYRPATDEENSLSPFVNIECVENDYDPSVSANGGSCPKPEASSTIQSMPSIDMSSTTQIPPQTSIIGLTSILPTSTTLISVQPTAIDSMTVAPSASESHI